MTIHINLMSCNTVQYIFGIRHVALGIMHTGDETELQTWIRELFTQTSKETNFSVESN